jgi:4-aminobutyrate aminotransferase-like enzyme
MGEFFLNRLKTLNRDYIKDIRGRGLFMAIEFKEN